MGFSNAIRLAVGCGSAFCRLVSPAEGHLQIDEARKGNHRRRGNAFILPTLLAAVLWSL
jgi:hypothetical protein